MIKAVIFDLDGTLADTMDDLSTAMNAMLRQFGYPERSREELVRFINKGARLFVGQSLPEGLVDGYDDPKVDEALKVFRSNYAKCYADKTHAYEGIKEQVECLKEKGIRLGVLSNKPEEFVKVIVDKLFPGLFDSVHGQANLPTKPNPASAFMVAEELGVKAEECAFVGDSDIDMTTAINAGMIPVAVSWGYRPEECLREAGAAVVVHSPQKTAEVLLSLDGKSEKKQNNGIVWLPLCISLGISLGLVFGSVTENIPIGLGVGVAVGAAVGVALGVIVYALGKKK